MAEVVSVVATLVRRRRWEFWRGGEPKTLLIEKVPNERRRALRPWLH